MGQLGVVPFTTSVLSSLLGEFEQRNHKISRMERAGDIIRLKRGMYVVSPLISHQTLSTELIANHLYAPSYLSCLTALRYYGIIPEQVCRTQSMTIKHTRSFHTSLGEFSYTNTNREAFSVGVTSITENGYSFLIATPEKALCDLIATSPQVTLRYITEARRYLEEDIRFDMDAFAEMDKAIFREYIAVGKKASSIQTLLKLLEQYQENANDHQDSFRKMSDKMDPISKRIIMLLKSNPTASASELSKKIKGVTPRTIERSIAKLKTQGRLRRIGPDKGGHWEVIE